MGSIDGAEVVQLLGFPSSAEEPPQQLKGFKKVALKSGEKQTLTFDLDERATSIWDISAHAWAKVEGTFEVTVGNILARQECAQGLVFLVIANHWQLAG